MDKSIEEKALKALARQEKQYRRQNDWTKNHYDRVSVTLPKGTKDRIAELGKGKTVNAFVRDAVTRELERLERESGMPADDVPF